MSRSVYLIVTHVTRLAKGINSNQKGVSSNPDNYETFENMILSDRVPNRMNREASVIIDLLNGKVVKNRFGATDTETFRAYVDRYQADIGAALRKWGIQNPDNYNRLRDLADTASPGATDDKTDSD